MQRMSYRLISKGTLHAIKTSYRLSRFKRNASYLSNQPLSHQPQNATKRFATAKKIMQISGIALLSLPARSLTTHSSNNSYAYDNVIISNTLTIGSVKGNSTFFATDGFQHGFGYDLARSYANHLGVKLELKTFDDTETALQAVQLGQIDMALTTASTAMTEEHQLASLNLSCGQDKPLTDNGLHPKVNWSFKTAKDPLAIRASQFLCESAKEDDTDKLASFYNQNLLKDAYNQQHFKKALTNKLPNYKTSFQEQANYYNHDWELLVAMGYQESHLNADAVSPTGVQGLMMLTNNTAEAMGVSNRIDPYQSISGGARYLELMKGKFEDVPNPDRLWFALASYNMGPNAVKKIQQELENRGEDGNSWSNVYAYMSDNAQENSRYVQCMHYVKNIRSYLESIKTQTI